MINPNWKYKTTAELGPTFGTASPGNTLKMFVKNYFMEEEKGSILAKIKNSSRKLFPDSVFFDYHPESVALCRDFCLFCSRTSISALKPSQDSNTPLILPRG